MNLFFNTRNVTTKGVYNMKKSKRLEIVSTIVKKHKIYKKE
ncbi:ArgR family transcriptional regulator, partial [Staphylococcus aureus]|nr:ArgR family transcriptional regulator [Staphylococcus aureus]